VQPDPRYDDTMLEIHAPPPVLVPSEQRRFSTVEDALFAIWATRGEQMFWIWNGVPIRVAYRVVFSSLFRSVLGVVEALIDRPAGDGPYGLREGEIIAQLEMAWGSGVVAIDAEWHLTPGRLEMLLAARRKIEMPIADFLAEWKMPLARIVESIATSGVEIDKEAPLLERVRRAEAAISQPGRIYRYAQ
jgi:hypothetical protein